MAYDPTRFEPLSFSGALQAFASGRDTPRDYLERCLRTIEQREPEVLAFTVLNPEGAREAADESTRRHRDGKPLSPIDGMPIGIKDLYETKDMPTQYGSPIFKGYRPVRDCAPVWALRRSGAIIVGKTVTTEFGFYSPGPTRNPFDPSRTPGGSSSGSAAAVGACMLPATIGSQVVGSLIRPAGYCGHIGYKPTFGALNRGGSGTGLSQACIGVHAGTLTDMWAVAHQIAATIGGDPGHPGLSGEAAAPAAQKPKRLIRLETAGWNATEAPVRQRFEAALARLSREGVEIVDAGEFEPLVAAASEIAHDVCGYELRWRMIAYREEDPNALSEDIRKRLAGWEKLTPQQYRNALARREELRRAHAALRDRGDALVTLSAPGAAPAGLASTGNPVYAIPGSVLGAPAISLPVLEAEGMPLGLQLIGYPHADAQLAGLARWLLRVLGAESAAR